MTKEEYDALKVPFPIDSAARDAVFMGLRENNWHNEQQHDDRFNVAKAKKELALFPDLNNMFL